MSNSSKLHLMTIRRDDRIEPHLQPLRVAGGWTVHRNLFTAYDPEPKHIDYFYGSALFVAEPIRSKTSLELTFEPEGDPDGEYVVTLHRYFKECHPSWWDEPIFHTWLIVFERRTTQRLEVVQLLETMMAGDWEHHQQPVAVERIPASEKRKAAPERAADPSAGRAG